ncbi:39S ribosomal protein L36, mitochondrial [Scophthalmus maximus]|uniref:39S ribosomal protein L36, mitochondrial n=1 Tax=Scophthalmus maximus TaxID=52904 RepID=UPI001FA8C120|nr:39S ribosomal protein L36, mitochondrial [Scophthalmus maximus]
MAPLLLRHLAASLSRRVAQMSGLNMTFSSPAASAYRRLFTLTTAPRTLLLSPGTVSGASPIQAPPSSQCGPSLLGQCRHLPCIQPSAGMKTKSALKRRCKDCFFVRRRGRLFVFCKTSPRHKQRQG